MKNSMIRAILAAGMMALATVSYAQDASKGEAAAKANGCLGCHSVSAKKIGPAYKLVAAKFKSGGANALIAAFRKSEDHSELKVKDDDLKNIAAWIMKL